MGSSKRDIVHTLLYHDIFEYPLSYDQLWLLLISDTKKSISKKQFNQHTLSLKQEIVLRNGFFCLKGRSKIIQLRFLREKESSKKVIIARRVARFLCKIPTIHFIGLSGSVALKNAQKHDDIDLFFIVQNNSIWITRFLVFVVLELLHIGRRRKKKKIANLICPNMFLALSSLEIPSPKRNIYIAHEIIQTLPLFDRSAIHDLFLYRNRWILEYMPNSFLVKKVIVQRVSWNWLTLVEKIAKMIQMWYIKRHITTEIISDTMLAFHPKSYEKHVLYEFERRRKKYEKI